MDPITIIIRTLNEENNIERCLRSCLKNGVAEILVVDGGSADSTIEKIKQFPKVKIVESPKGITLQLFSALKYVSPKSKYIGVVDADDFLDDRCMPALLEDLKTQNAVAAQAKHGFLSDVEPVKMNYWEKAMVVNLDVIRIQNGKQEITMVGRPCLYEKKALLRAIEILNPGPYNLADDTKLSFIMKENGGKFTLGSGVTYRRHLAKVRPLVKKWFYYGRADIDLMFSYPQKIWTTLVHVLWNYPVNRACIAARYHGVQYMPFFMCHGFFRFMGILYYFPKTLWGKIFQKAK